jgi:hypothetical protein
MNRDGFAAVSLRHPSRAPPSAPIPFRSPGRHRHPEPVSGFSFGRPLLYVSTEPAFHSRPHSREAPTRRGWPACRLAATTASRARWSGCSSPSTDRRSLAATTRGAKVSSSPSPTVSVRTMSSAAYPPSRSTTARCQPVRVDGGDQRRLPLPAPGGVPDPRRRGARLRERPAGRWVRLVGLHRQLPGGFPLVVSQRGLVALALARGRLSAEPRAARAAGARLRPPPSRCRATIAASIPARP